MLHADTHAISRTRAVLRTACTVLVAASSVVALALPSQAADQAQQSEVPVTEPAEVAPAEAAAPLEETTAVADPAAADEPVPSDVSSPSDEDQPVAADDANDPALDEDGLDAAAAAVAPDLETAAGALRTLTTRVVPSGGMVVLIFRDLPENAVAVELKVTASAAARTTSLTACASWANCDNDPVVVAERGQTTSGTQVVRLGGNAKNRVTLHSSSAAVRVTPAVVRFVIDDEGVEPAPSQSPAKPAPSPAKPAPAPAPAPARGGKPGADNTGVPAGVSLRIHDGDLTITEAGTVVDGLDIRGFVRVKAPNVTIKNSVVRGKSIAGDMSLIQSSSTNLLVQDTELAPTQRTPRINGIVGKSFTLRRVDIHHVVDQVHLTGGGVRIEASWLHDNLHWDYDPAHNDGTHDDSIQIQAGSAIDIVGNTIEDANNAAVMITQDTGKVANVTFVDNWVDGGACTINVAEKGRGAIRGLVVAENTFGRNTRHKNCAVLAPSTTKISMDDNFYTDGKLVSVTKG